MCGAGRAYQSTGADGDTPGNRRWQRGDVQQGTEHDPEPADFLIDDFEIVALDRGR